MFSLSFCINAPPSSFLLLFIAKPFENIFHCLFTASSPQIFEIHSQLISTQCYAGKSLTTSFLEDKIIIFWFLWYKYILLPVPISNYQVQFQSIQCGVWKRYAQLASLMGVFFFCLFFLLIVLINALIISIVIFSQHALVPISKPAFIPFCLLIQCIFLSADSMTGI